MSEIASPWPQPLEQRLPVEVTGAGHGWFTRYRVYPVFSGAWVRGRLLVFGLIGALVAALVVLLLLEGPAQDLPWGGMLNLGVQIWLPLLLGPWLGHRVRRWHWPPAREWWTLVAAMAALVAAVLAFHQWGAEPVKQYVAERTGMVDEQGRRRRVLLSVGVSIITPEPQASAPNPKLHPEAMDANAQLPPMVRLANGISSAALTFWLAGGAALWGWRRERAALAALAQARELARAQAQRREAEMRLSVLAAQVEPHFLFNTLAGVRSAIATDPPRASEMIDRLVDYLRAAIPRLRTDGGAQATLGGQLEIVRAYLGLMAARMPRLRFAIDAPTELLAAPCPPLMLISLAENAVKHGAEPKIGPVQVAVSARRAADGGLDLEVADDGAGFGSQTSGSGLGLANIRDRLQQIYQGRASLTLRARPQGGVAALLHLPPETPA